MNKPNGVKGGRLRNNLVRKENQPLQLSLHMQGYDDEEVAAKITAHNKEQGFDCKPVSATAVRHDRREAVKKWANQSLWQVNEIRVTQAFKMERIFREAMAAWEKSKEAAQRTTANFEGVGDSRKQVGPTSISRTTQYGDPRFLNEARMALSEISRLFGAYPDTPVEPPLSADGSQRVAIAYVFKTEKSVKELTNFPIIDVAPDAPPKLGLPEDDGEHDSKGNGATED